MKKQLTVALGLAVLATPAFASKARLLALGEDANGSFYVNDNRNIFLNASEVNNHKDLVTFEWGGAAPTADGSANNPNAEGGLFRSYNNMVYGVQFGRNLSFNEGHGELGTNSKAADNAIDLFVGGDAGMKWGAQLTYSSGKDDGVADTKTNVIDLAAGVTHGDIAGYVKYGVSGKAEAGAEEVKRKSDIEVGGSYKWDNYTAFGQYGMKKFEEDASNEEIKSNEFQLGVGRAHKLNDKATLFSKIAYVNSNVEFDDGTKEEDKVWTLPLTIGLEYDATSWLVLRASVSQALQSKQDNESNNTKGTVPETTTVAAGATLKFGELSVDGMIGNNNTGAAAPTSDDTSTGNGQLRTDSLMSRVAVTYRF